MGVDLIFRCDGCHKEQPGTAPLRQEFRSFSGRSWGFGGAVMTNYPKDVCPEGWVAYDPYTYCTYCPECWRGIVESDPKEERDAD